jgi:hypothetical protein
MTIRCAWSAPVHTPRNAGVVVLEALLPMLLWPSVPLIRLAYEDLTVVDRFMVEAALALAPMRAEDVEEVTAIPRHAVTRIAGRLTGLGLLRADRGDYYPVEAAAMAALERRAVPEHRTMFVTLLYLPTTDELVAFAPGPGRPDPPLLQKAKTVERAPLPPTVAGSSRTELVRAHVRTGRVAGLPDDVVDAVDAVSQDALPDSCPAYRCRGHVRWRGGDATLVLDVIDDDGRRAAQCRVPGAAGQAAAWAALAGQAESAGDAWRAEGGEVAAIQEDTAAWAYWLDGTAAEAATGEGIALSEPAGLQIHSEPGPQELGDACAVAVSARFVPADDTATRVFALNHAIRALIDQDPDRLAPDAAAATVAAARSAYGLADQLLTESEVTDRLWTDQHYRHSYALRAARDFAYG